MADASGVQPAVLGLSSSPGGMGGDGAGLKARWGGVLHGEGVGHGGDYIRVRCSYVPQ